MKDRLSNLKNLLWAAAILLCLAALLIGLIFAMSQKKQGERPDGTLVLGQIERTGGSKADVGVLGMESAVGTTLNTLPESNKGNLETVFGMTFLCDKTVLGLRTYAQNYGEGVSAQIWSDNGSGFSAKNAPETNIVFYDGSLITAASAAMVTRPKTMVLYFGGDGLYGTSEQEFIGGYTRLIEDIRGASPSTQIIVCSIGSVSSNYQGADGLDPQLISQANAWIRQVCINTGAYYADLASFLNDDSGYLSDAFLTPDGRSIAAAGIALIVDYFRFHYV